MDRVKELASIQATLRAEIKAKAKDLKDARAYLKEVQAESDALAQPSLDLECEIA